MIEKTIEIYLMKRNLKILEGFSVKNYKNMFYYYYFFEKYGYKIYLFMDINKLQKYLTIHKPQKTNRVFFDDE